MMEFVINKKTGGLWVKQANRLYPAVKPLKVDRTHVYIHCPYCGEEHVHGSRGGRGYGGFRVSHCTAGCMGDDEYYIIEEETGLC